MERVFGVWRDLLVVLLLLLLMFDKVKKGEQVDLIVRCCEIICQHIKIK